MAQSLHELIQKIWKMETSPKEWSEGLVVPLFKEGETTNPDNYRGITLLSIVAKVFASILNSRLKVWCEKNSKLMDEQGGFRSIEQKLRGPTACTDGNHQSQEPTGEEDLVLFHRHKESV